jgi:hypothetical protein
MYTEKVLMLLPAVENDNYEVFLDSLVRAHVTTTGAFFQTNSCAVICLTPIYSWFSLFLWISHGALTLDFKLKVSPLMMNDVSLLLGRLFLSSFEAKISFFAKTSQG